jgi:hypothetical protein
MVWHHAIQQSVTVTSMTSVNSYGRTSCHAAVSNSVTAWLQSRVMVWHHNMQQLIEVSQHDCSMPLDQQQVMGASTSHWTQVGRTTSRTWDGRHRTDYSSEQTVTLAVRAYCPQCNHDLRASLATQRHGYTSIVLEGKYERNGCHHNQQVLHLSFWRHVSTSEGHLQASNTKYIRGIVYSFVKFWNEFSILLCNSMHAVLSNKSIIHKKEQGSFY